MRIFEDDDAGYLTWIDSHQHGFVVNFFPSPIHAISSSIGQPAAPSRANPPAASAGQLASTSKRAQRHAPISTTGRSRTSVASCIRAASVGLTDRVLFQ
jgi:hypothetical protein